MIKLVSYCVTACLAILVLATWNAYADSPGAPVALLALDNDGRVMVETELEFAKNWTMVCIGDPLTLTDFMPRSVVAATPELLGLCEDIDPEAAAACVNYSVMLKSPECETNCRFPLRPVGRFYGIEFNDGGWAILRLLADALPVTIEANYLGDRYQLRELTPLEVAALQVFEDDPMYDMSKSTIESAVAYADCISLIAYSEMQGQMDALEHATKVAMLIEDHFYSVHGQYSHSLCQLYTGISAVVGDLPRNAYDFKLDLCATEYSIPRPEGAIRYFPYSVGDTPEEERVVGYAIAILGPGESTDPPNDLPAQYAVPLRAIKWFVIHETDATDSNKEKDNPPSQQDK